MRDSNIPKFLKDDIPLFDAIVRDLFPEMDLPVPSYYIFMEGLERHCRLNYLQMDGKQLDKIIQFYETLKVRFGIMIVGEAMIGKTSIYQALYGAMNYLYKNERYKERSDYFKDRKELLNLKSISINELYDEFSHFTQEWTDGLASDMIRIFVNNENKSMK